MSALWCYCSLTINCFCFPERTCLVQGNPRLSSLPQAPLISSKHLLQGYAEYAFIKRELLLWSLQTKNSFLKPSRCLISDRGWGGDIWLDCWCVKAWSCGVYLEFIIFYFHSLRMCNHLKDANAGFHSCFCFVGCVHSKFFLLYASSMFI